MSTLPIIPVILGQAGNIPIVNHSLDLTTWFSIITVSFAVMMTLIKIFGTKKIKKEEMPGFAPSCIKHQEALDEIDKYITENKIKQENLKDLIIELNLRNSLLKKDVENDEKGIDELRSNYRDLTVKIDDLLNRLMDFIQEN